MLLISLPFSFNQLCSDEKRVYLAYTLSGANGGTVATIQNRILGFHDYGVEAVTNWVNTGGIERSALQWRDAIMEELEV